MITRTIPGSHVGAVRTARENADVNPSCARCGIGLGRQRKRKGQLCHDCYDVTRFMQKKRAMADLMRRDLDAEDETAARNAVTEEAIRSAAA